jgi:hypothetical protein
MSATFSYVVLTDPSNQLGFNAYPKSAIINVPPPATTRNYIVPDVGSDANFVMSEGAQTINGDKTFGGNIYLPTSGGTASALNYYEEYNTTLPVTSGTFTGTLNSNTKIVREGRMVTLTMQGMSITSKASGADAPFVVASGTIPIRFRPVNDVTIMINIINQAVNVPGTITVLANGGINIYRFNGTSNINGFTTGGNTNAFSGCTVAYNL